jgi:small subunit ribosomal protein S4
MQEAGSWKLEAVSDKDQKSMARYSGPVCRLCRREGMKLFLKGERCYTEKCAIEKRNLPPGQHGKLRKAKVVGYGLQLREKQKVKRIYGVLENQFRRYFEMADRTRGITGETLLQLLERRLDNVLYRLGLATSRAQARQLARHGHFTVNGRKVDIPSYQVKPGDVVGVRASSAENPAIQHALEEVKGRGVPEWLSFDSGTMSGRIASLPTREQINLPVQEQLIVELYSK